ncbi:hypothetical protein ACLB1E_31440 [Escherichia coli]
MVVIPPPPAVAPSATINPANGNVLATVQAAGREDVDRAVTSAQGKKSGRR